MKYDYSKLRGRIVEKFGTNTEFAKALGKDSAYVARYLNQHSGFSQDVVLLWANTLDISPSEIGVYFYTLKVVD